MLLGKPASATSTFWALKKNWCSPRRPNPQVKRKWKLDVILPKEQILWILPESKFFRLSFMWKEARPISMCLNLQAVVNVGSTTKHYLIWFFNYRQWKGVTKGKNTNFLQNEDTLNFTVTSIPSEKATVFLISKLGQKWNEQVEEWRGLAKRSSFLYFFF